MHNGSIIIDHDYCNAYLDTLSTDISSIELRDSSGSVLLPVKSDKGKALASVVHVHDAPALLKLGLGDHGCQDMDAIRFSLAQGPRV